MTKKELKEIDRILDRYISLEDGCVCLQCKDGKRIRNLIAKLVLENEGMK